MSLGLILLNRALDDDFSGGMGVAYDTNSQDYFTRAEALGGSDTFDATAVDGYDSSFNTGDTEGWNSVNGTRTSNIDGIGGEDNCLRFTIGAGTNSTTGLEAVGKNGTYTYTARVYIPSSNSDIDGVQIGLNGTPSTALDEWVTITGTDTTQRWRIVATSGGSRIGLSDAGADDVFYVKDIVIRNTAYAGLTPEGSKALIDAMVVSMKAKGTWDKMREIYLHGIVSFGGLAAKLKYSTNPTLTLYNFVSGDYVQAGPLAGSTGDASAKYIDTNFIDSSLDPDDKSLGVYLMENAGVTTNRVMGVGDGSNSIAIQPNGTSLAAGITESDARIFNIIPNATGFGVITRRGANDVEAYGNGVSTGTDNATAGYSAMAYNYFLFARNNQGTAERWSDPRAGLFFIGEGLTANDVQNLMDDFDALMDAIGAGVVYGPELFSDTTLDAPGDWNVSGGVAISGGEATFTAAANGSQISQAVLLDGVTYRFQYEIVSISNGGVQARAGFGIGAVNTAPGVYTEEITCITSTNAQFRSQLAPTDAIIDNVSVREVL